MSIKTVQSSSLTPRRIVNFSNFRPQIEIPWVRNPSWPACEANTGDNKIVGLHAVWPGDGIGTGGNFFAMTISGAYTIDFGDGTTTNFVSGNTAQREYDYNNANLANTNAPVTFTASTNTVNRTDHGYINGDIVKFYDIVTTTGIDQEQEYYVTNATANTFQISRKSYGHFSVAAQEVNPTGLFFKPDGTKMYVNGSTGDDVNEYDLSTAWDVSTASFLQLFSVAAQEAIPQGLFFKPDGTKMYIIGSNGDDVNEYDLSTAWDVSTASFLQLFSVAAQEGEPNGLFFKPDGTKMYVIGSTGDDVNEYDLSTAWDISTASFLQLFSVAAQEIIPTGLFFKPDGTKMYVIGSTGDDVNEYNLSTAWNVSTASFLQLFSVANKDLDPQGLFFKDDGTKMYVVGISADTVFAYDLSTAWDISTATFGIDTNIIDFTNDGSAALLPYKIATITITPQAANDLTNVNFFVKNNQAGLVNGYSTGWLDIAIALPSCTTLTIGSGATTIRHSYLERVRLNQMGNITSFLNLFNTCRVLQNVVIADTITTVNTTELMFNACSLLTSVPLINTANVTSMASMFNGCNSLTSVPLFNTANVTNMTSMFSSCRSLTSVPFFNTANVTTMATMFTSCSSLTSVPLINTANVTSMGSMFNGCSSLTSVPLFDTTKVTNMVGMFQNSSSLTSVPLFDTTNVTGISSMFSGCFSLTSVPFFNTTKVTSMGSMFQSCSSLTSVPFFNTANVTDIGSMFSSCRSLTSVPLFNTANVTIMTGMFNGCSSLTSVPLFDTTKVTTMDNMFSSCFILTSVPLFNTANVTIMTGMFNGCSSLTSVPLFDTTKVTNMVVMFASCVVLTSVPLFNTANVTNMTSMFTSCSSLTSVPLFNTANVTNISFMFNGCVSLVSVPALVTTAVTPATNFSNMFATCTSLARIEAKDFRFTFSLASCKLSAAALDEIYTNLPTVTSQTITVTGNYGVAGDDPTIATGKGWTVTG